MFAFKRREVGLPMSFDNSQAQTSIITVKSIEKIFRMYQLPQDRLKQMIMPRLKFGNGSKEYFDKFTALKNINLNLGRGETVGIVGRNGSGKSTLLQIICGTLQPTSDEVIVNGRVAALLELGAGFNPEFTGRENVYLNGAIVGLNREEIDERFEQIARFANIGQFMDQPTKSYSSGMYVRLAFSVAIHADPDVLIVDEALSVGDESFQRKCFARIEDMQSRGTTILFVSHSAKSVIELCDRAILLDGGEILLEGTPKKVVGQYQKLMNLTGNEAKKLREAIKQLGLKGDKNSLNDGAVAARSAPQNESSSGELNGNDPSWYDPSLISSSALSYEILGGEIIDPHIRNSAGQKVNYLAVGRRYTVHYSVDIHKAVKKLLFGCMFKTISGVALGGANNIRVDRAQLKEAKEGDRIRVEFDFTCHLMPGTYFVTAGLMSMVDEDYVFLHRIVDALAIHVMEGTNSAPYDVGLTALTCEMRTSHIPKT